MPHHAASYKQPQGRTQTHTNTHANNPHMIHFKKQDTHQFVPLCTWSICLENNLSFRRIATTFSLQLNKFSHLKSLLITRLWSHIAVLYVTAHF